MVSSPALLQSGWHVEVIADEVYRDLLWRVGAQFRIKTFGGIHV